MKKRFLILSMVVCILMVGSVFAFSIDDFFDFGKIKSSTNSISGLYSLPYNEDADGISCCKNKCGDGICQSMVLAVCGAPCSETKASCPGDCDEKKEVSKKDNKKVKKSKNKKK